MYMPMKGVVHMDAKRYVYYVHMYLFTLFSIWPHSAEIGQCVIGMNL